MNTFKGSPLALPLTFETHQLSEGFSSIVYDARGMAIDTHLSEAQAETIVTAVNAYDKQRALIETLVKALEESAQRNVYDGDYFHDIGLSDRMRASWNAEKQARAALAAAKEQSA